MLLCLALSALAQPDFDPRRLERVPLATGLADAMGIDVLDDGSVIIIERPGGVLLLIDHYAADGSGDRDSNRLHRIDIALVKAELAAAGFVLESESDLLRNPADPRTASVFDPAINGRTDQFVLKFRKPA